jgi:hypothetical protein
MPWGQKKTSSAPHQHSTAAAMTEAKASRWRMPAASSAASTVLELFIIFGGPSPTLFHYHMPPQGFRHHFFCYADC